jgi:hypothetical protein
MTQKTRPVLPKTVLREITIGNAVSPGLALRHAEKADREADWADLDGRRARGKELRKRAQTLRKLADEVSAQV